MNLPPLTEHTAALLQQIWSRPTRFDRFLRKPDHRLPLIEQVAQSGEIAAVPSLLDLLLDSSPGIAAAASQCLHRLVSTIHPHDFPAFDEEIRGAAYWQRPMSWDRLRPEDLPKLPVTPTSRSSILGLATLHRNGFVRESAVRELDLI